MSRVEGARRPAPFVCAACLGDTIVPHPEGGIGECPLCGGSGYACAVGDLGPTRSQKTRPFCYDPATRTLTLFANCRPTAYRVAEFRPDVGFDGRAFRLTKDGGDSYSLLIGRGWAQCDCAGSSYEASGKANRRAFECGDPILPTLGCRHADALAKLLPAGWLDLPEHVPADREAA